MSVHWLSKDIVSFEIEFGVYEKFTKMWQWFQLKKKSHNLLCKVNVAIVTIALPVVCLFCTLWATFCNLWEHLTCCCLCIVLSLLIALRYGKFGPIYRIRLVAVEVWVYVHQALFSKFKTFGNILVKFLQRCLVFVLYMHHCKFGGCMITLTPDILVLGHFGPCM